mmetsp:Transcript_4024/g.9900  ORF Transcript_4024/g.9900 Transcript_4024/m.9900 type:complete len:679 (+) Transcript_4024:234-2270(+)
MMSNEGGGPGASAAADTAEGFRLADKATADILLKSIQYLNVVDSGRLATTSKRMYYLVHQYRKLRLAQRPDIGIATIENRRQYIDEGGDARRTVQSAIEKSQTKPNLVLCHELRERRGSDPYAFVGLKDALEQKFDSSTVICGVVGPAIQVNLPTMTSPSSSSSSQDACGAADGSEKKESPTFTSTSTVSHRHLCALLTASFSDSTILPFCLGDDRDDGKENISRRMKEIEEKNSNKTTQVNTDDISEGQESGSKRKHKDDDGKVTANSESYWKAMIVYACGHSGNEVEEFVQIIQSQHPSISIVGGVCSGGYVSVGKGDTSLMPSYRKDELAAMKVRELKRLATEVSSNNHDNFDVSTLVEKNEVVDYIHDSLKNKVDKSGTSSAEVSRVESGIFGVILGGSIPVRSMVSRGVKSLMNGRDDDFPTRWMVQEAESAKQSDVHFPEELQRLGIPDHLRFHFIESVRNEETGQVLSARQVLDMRLTRDADFIGIRDDSNEEGFELSPWNNQLSQMTDRLIVIDDKRGPSSSKPIEIDFFELDGQASLDDMHEAAATLKKQTKDANEEVLCALMVSCNGRGPVSSFLNGEAMADARRFNKSFPEVPLVGFYAGGEIGPMARARRNGHNVYRKGSVAFQGFTAVFALFIVPRIESPKFDLDDSVESVQKYIDQSLGKSSAS